MSSEPAPPAATRPLLVGGDDGPETPFPLRMEGNVTTGFQRGSTLLGFPTANIPINDALTPWINTMDTGVYFGWSSLRLPPTHADHAAPADSPYALYPMVMSIGYNPYFKNTVRTAEVHILHTFAEPFYGEHMRLLILGYVRPEKDYPSLDALIADIKFDTDVARASLSREAWAPRDVGVVGGWEAGKLDVSWLVREPEAEAEAKPEETKVADKAV
ncbi:related to FMN1 - Riboflavin kinase [Cephalotrichum gorgonifer]|uniref:Riboflavin kinase n=1 Tax=Cephalotrichum gorgonifer TaxID=2041049 RepID=A0AAE8N3V9_9PEZI|nr:related to FMN1 - Riboflavin kinase [Cephalotrichum gorgonifer]